jgi:hypothetical protein
MKYFLANLGINLVALLCICLSGYLLLHDKGGWGWFLFVGLLCAGTATFKGEKENEKGDGE